MKKCSLHLKGGIMDKLCNVVLGSAGIGSFSQEAGRGHSGDG